MMIIFFVFILQWKCLLAQYIAPHIVTPIFVMNAAYDAWQMGNILHTKCVPTPTHACDAPTNASLLLYRNAFVKSITTWMSSPLSQKQNGVFLDGCYVHEQNVNYCSSQGMPNCVGWSPLEPGSIKWGYTTAITVPDGRSLTPQQAFGAFYRGDRAASVAIDKSAFFNNPHCIYLGKPAPTPPAPTPPPPPPGSCVSVAGMWFDPHWGKDPQGGVVFHQGAPACVGTTTSVAHAVSTTTFCDECCLSSSLLFSSFLFSSLLPLPLPLFSSLLPCLLLVFSSSLFSSQCTLCLDHSCSSSSSSDFIVSFYIV